MTTMTSMIALMGGMTANERAQGRFLRDGDGHPAAPTPDVAPGEAGGADEAAIAELGAHELPGVEAPEVPASETEQKLAKEFGQEEAPSEEGVAAEEGTADKPAEEETPPADDPVKKAQDEAAESARQAKYWKDVAEGRIKPDNKSEDTPAVEAEAEPKAEDYEYGEADPKFIADTARFHARAEFRDQQEQAKNKEQFAQLDAKWKGNIARDTERLPDFKAKVLDTAERGDWPCPLVISLGIRDSEVGPDVAYHLASNIDEAKRIAALTPIEQAREFGRLEAGFMSQMKERTPSTVRTVTKTPPPPAATARGAGGKFATPADTDDFAAFERSVDARVTTR